MAIKQEASDRLRPIERVTRLLLSPRAEWSAIAAEAAAAPRFSFGYVCVLAAIPAAAKLVGATVFGVGAYGVELRRSVASETIGAAAVGYGLHLAGFFALVLVVEQFSPAFGGQASRPRALRLLAYAATAGWVSGLLHLYPALGALTLLGWFYSAYLLYLGFPLLTGAPASKALGFTAATVLAALCISGVAAVAADGVDRAMISIQAGSLSAAVRLPGGTTVEVADLRDAAKRLRTVADQLTAPKDVADAGPGGVRAVAPETLAALMPDRLPGGLERGALTTARRAAAGLVAAKVRGVYANGERRIVLSVTDLAAAGALAGGLDIRASRRTAAGYEEIGRVDGRMTRERFDRQTRSGKYAVMVANRFVIEAEGSNVDMASLKTAAAAIGFDRLEGLSKPG